MTNILFIGFPAEGHTNPSLAVIEELVNRGENVVYYSTENYQTKIEKTGATFRGFYDFVSALDLSEQLASNEPMDRMKMMTLMLNAQEEIIDQIYDEVCTETYDYVFYDYHFMAGKVIAQKLKLPNVSFCTTFAMNESFASFMSSNEAPNPEHSPYFSQFIEIKQKMYERFQVNIQSSIDVMSNPGNKTLVFTSEYFQPGIESIDTATTFVGPSITKRKDVAEMDLSKEKKPLLFISMGTIFNQQQHLYNQFFETFASFEGTVLLSVGRKTDISSLNNIPNNFIVKNYVPQLDVLRQADVFVTHGGMNSTSEGLYFDTPLVVIPQAVDQFFVAHRVTELGAGLQLDKTMLTQDALKQAVQTVLENGSYKTAAEKVGKSLREAGGYLKAVDDIYTFIKEIKTITN